MARFMRRVIASIEKIAIVCALPSRAKPCPSVNGLHWQIPRGPGQTLVLSVIVWLGLCWNMTLAAQPEPAPEAFQPAGRTPESAGESTTLESWKAEGRLNLLRFLSGDPGADGEALADWLYLHPVYRDLYEAGSDVGGARAEFRDQNRARQLSRRGFDLAAYGPQWTAGLRASTRAITDYHYFRRNSRRADLYNQAGENFVYLRWLPGATGQGDPLPDSSALLSSAPLPSLTRYRREALPAAGLYLQAGRSQLRTDPEGLLYVGESAGARLIYSGGDSSAPGVFGKSGARAGGLRASVAAQRVDREVRAVGRRESRDWFYTGTLGWLGDGWSAGLLYGFYRQPGRAARTDLFLPGLPPTQVTLPVGQAARLDQDVHYYGVRLETARFESVTLRLAGYYNAGRSIAVDEAGTRIGTSRRGIRGGLGYAEFVLHLDPSVGLIDSGCLAVRPASVSCVRSAPLARGPELALAGLFSSRDANDGDDRQQGFGALRPRPSVLGGSASIFLSGPPVERERRPLGNFQPGTIFADGGLPDVATGYPDGPQSNGLARARNNDDPAGPDYENGGLQIGSLRASFAPLYALSSNVPEVARLSLELYANYAQFREGRGWEGIVAVRWPFELIDAQFALEASATAATYRSNAQQTDALTGQLRRADRRYYSRYRLGIALAL